jgi:hypothetical protein
LAREMESVVVDIASIMVKNIKTGIRKKAIVIQVKSIR